MESEGKENGNRPPTIFGLKVALGRDDEDLSRGVTRTAYQTVA